jgi:mRNA-degrading endonuclease toxin of MazEF toxin-antitoxin module
VADITLDEAEDEGRPTSTTMILIKEKRAKMVVVAVTTENKPAPNHLEAEGEEEAQKGLI